MKVWICSSNTWVKRYDCGIISGTICTHFDNVTHSKSCSFGVYAESFVIMNVTLRYDGGAVKIDTRKNYEQLYKTFI